MKNTNKRKYEEEKPDASKILKDGELVVQGTIISRLRKKYEIQDRDARKVFDLAIESGAIIQTGMAGIYPGLKIYKKK